MGDCTPSWFDRRTSRWQDWPARRLLELKLQRGSRISVVIPARNEARTVAGVAGAVSRSLIERIPLVDELVVIVYRARDVAPALGGFPGKGEALWKSLLVTRGDLLVFIDADLTLWGPHFVTGLLGPLLSDDQVRLVKGFYTRVRTESDGSTSTEGGRVTELVARPLISLWWPELAGVVQPLAGEWAARRSLMESLNIPVGYGVELATLMDTVARHGLDAVAQVDLGTRAHRHQANHDLALMAAELLVVAERRRPAGKLPAGARLQQFERAAGQLRRVSRPVPAHERPPAGSVPGWPGVQRPSALEPDAQQRNAQRRDGQR